MNADQVLECFVEMSVLTRLPRTGWILAGVAEPESVADHCYETAIFAYVLSKYIDEPVDLKKIFIMALFHEIGEARMADLPRRSKDYVRKMKRQAERDATTDILGRAGVLDEVVPLLDELHDLSSPEARLVEAAEELQIIFRAMVYAKECRGDISEYRNDVEKYDSQGFEVAHDLAMQIKERLNNYLNGKEYWEIGYKKHQK